jgi:hypothetical protein
MLILYKINEFLFLRALQSVFPIRIDSNADPDPAFQVKIGSNAVPDPEFQVNIGSNADPDPEFQVTEDPDLGV